MLDPLTARLMLYKHNRKPFIHTGDGQSTRMTGFAGFNHLSDHILVRIRPVILRVAKLDIPLAHVEKQMQLRCAFPELEAGCDARC